MSVMVTAISSQPEAAGRCDRLDEKPRLFPAARSDPVCLGYKQLLCRDATTGTGFERAPSAEQRIRGAPRGSGGRIVAAAALSTHGVRWIGSALEDAPFDVCGEITCHAFHSRALANENRVFIRDSIR
ncbi:MAG: hypothetical protein EPN36_15460 [Rhodanobacteraceae bacterium]|nr:MAG: hypothetical protein EPN36_15460 [Rhodanobacteraceae bacterium]